MKNAPGLSDSTRCSAREAGLRLGHSQAANYKTEVCEVYDLLIGSGMEQKEAIKHTRAILKAINYPVVTYDGVITKLRASGRLKKNARTRM